MLCADSSSWIAYLSGESGDDISFLDTNLQARSVSMAPIVLAELLSSADLPSSVEANLCALPLMELLPGFWERAGRTRADLIRRKFKPKLADTLIAQVCIDHDIALHSRDADFRPFARYAGLQLVLHGQVH
jgi:predicted nucleic acid-binding protein